MITPEQKARELVESFKSLVSMTTKDNSLVVKVLDNDIAKQCALIAVEEILKRTRSVDTMPPNYQKIDENTKEYWEQVKIEIEKL
jgi:hypothetical protein